LEACDPWVKVLATTSAAEFNAIWGSGGKDLATTLAAEVKDELETAEVTAWGPWVTVLATTLAAEVKDELEIAEVTARGP